MKDRVIQAATKNIMEPIFEADFYPTSYGFRPTKSVHGAITHLKMLLLPRRDRRWKKPDVLPGAKLVAVTFRGWRTRAHGGTFEARHVVVRGVAVTLLSYARADGADVARQIVDLLVGAGHRVWWDQRNLDPFQDFTAEIEQGIEQATVVLVCVTAGTRRVDSFVRREIAYALAQRKAIVPILVDGTPPPVSIVTLTHVSFAGRTWSSAASELLARIRCVDSERSTPLDPFYDYLASLYKGIVDFLAKTVTMHVELGLRTQPRLEASKVGLRDTLAQLFHGHGLKVDGAEPQTQGAEYFTEFSQSVVRFQGRVLLLGGPGAGKTVTLLTYARNAVAARLNDGSLPLPLIGLLSSWNNEVSSFASWLIGGQREIDVDAAVRVIQQGRALILLDGLDELGAGLVDSERRDALSRFAHDFPINNSIVVTCRVDQTENPAVQVRAIQEHLAGVVSLQPLTKQQLSLYLAAAPELLIAAASDPNLHALLATPLIVKLFSEAYEELSLADRQHLQSLVHQPSELRDAIVERYVRGRYEWERRRRERHGATVPFSFADFSTHLGRLAMENAGTYRKMGDLGNYGRGNRIQSNVLIDADFQLLFGDDQRVAESFVRLCKEADLLLTRTDGSLSFRHLVMRNALAYRHSLIALRDQTAYSWYCEVVNPAEALARTGGVRAVSPLTDLLLDENEPCKLRECAANALGFTGDPACVDVLLTVLPRRSFAERTAQALGRLGDPRALQPLLEALRSDYRGARRGAADGLGLLGDDAAVESLVRALRAEDEDGFLSSNIVWSLCQIGIKGKDTLLSEIKLSLEHLHTDDIVCALGVGVLASFGDDRGVEIMLSALGDERPERRAMAAVALGSSGRRGVASALSRLLVDNAPVMLQAGRTVGQVAAYALARLQGNDC